MFFNCMCMWLLFKRFQLIESADHRLQPTIQRFHANRHKKKSCSFIFSHLDVFIFLIYCISLLELMFFLNFLKQRCSFGNPLCKMSVVKSSVINTWHILQSAPLENVLKTVFTMAFNLFPMKIAS